MRRYIDRVTPSIERNAFLNLIKAKLITATEGEVVVRAPLTAELTQQHGIGHAGVTFTLGDVAAGLAALTVLPMGVEVMTSEMKINLLRPARGEALEARGTILKAGRRLIVTRSDIFALQGSEQVLIATMLGTLVPVAP